MTMTGRQMQRLLTEHGLPVQKVTRKHDRNADTYTYVYTAEFFAPGMDKPVESANVWMKRIRTIIPNAELVTSHNTVASWRPDNPIIYATVVFKFNGENMSIINGIHFKDTFDLINSNWKDVEGEPEANLKYRDYSAKLEVTEGGYSASVTLPNGETLCTSDTYSQERVMDWCVWLIMFDIFLQEVSILSPGIETIDLVRGKN